MVLLVVVILILLLMGILVLVCVNSVLIFGESLVKFVGILLVVCVGFVFLVVSIERIVVEKKWLMCILLWVFLVDIFSRCIVLGFYVVIVLL